MAALLAAFVFMYVMCGWGCYVLCQYLQGKFIVDRSSGIGRLKIEGIKKLRNDNDNNKIRSYSYSYRN